MENKIILIEDDEEIRSMVKDYLSGEFQVLPFSEGKTAIHTVKNYDEYSLALIDLMLPDMSGMEIIKMVCWICLYFSPPFQSTRTARYSSHRRSGCHRPATPQCSSQCIRDRRCRCRSACSVCIFRRSSFVLLSSTGFLFLYILIITLLVAKVKFFPKKFCQKGT